MKNLKLKGTILKKSLSLFIILSCIMFISNQAKSAPTFTLSSFLTGAGTSESPYLIYRPTQMDSLSTFVNAGGATSYRDASWAWHPYYFQMQNDLDFENNTFTPIGTSTLPFSGIFDGGGYSIKNIKITGATNVGVFGYVSSSQLIPAINNLGVVGAVITGTNSDIGAIAGSLLHSTISNCFVANSTLTGGTTVGAIVGHLNSGSSVSNCYSQNYSITGSGKLGGIVGANDGSSQLINCYSTTKITSTGATQQSV